MRNITQFLVKDFTNIYSTFTSGSPVSVSPLYRVIYGNLPGSERGLTVVDKKFRISLGMHELCLKRPSKHFKDKLPGSESWDVEGELLMPTYPFNIPERMKKGNWREIIHFLVDDTGKKSECLVNIVLSHLVWCPYQNLNNHAIFLTQTSTGKTNTYLRVTGQEPATDVSLAGMFGTADKTDGHGWEQVPGSLEGSGLMVYDEFPEQDYAVVHRMLNYLESGETRRDIVSHVVCKGSKTVVFLGNYDKFTEDDLLSKIVGLATGKALDRVGKRFAHIIYSNLAEITPLPVKMDKLIQARIFINYALEYAEPKVNKIFNRAWKWMSQEDSDYAVKVHEIAKYCKNQKVRQFLDGCAIHSPRLRCAAVKRAIIEHLDEIILTKKSLYNVVLVPDILRFYEEFKEYNLQSFRNFESDEKRKFLTEYKAGVSVVELQAKANELGKDVTTLYRWLKEAGKDATTPG